MSELTPCNYCSYQDMLERAKKRGVEVILGKDEHGWVTARYSDQKKPSAWFMELPDHCVC